MSLCLCLQVIDAPRFMWRGVLLDVGRHFFPVPFILKVLDLLALYKMNKFHWHLTEDQVSMANCFTASTCPSRPCRCTVPTQLHHLNSAV